MHGVKHKLVADALRQQRSELRALVRRRLPDDEVEDLLQVAAVRAMERAEGLQDPARVRAWLFRIHRNLVVDVLRTRGRHLAADQDPDDIAAPEVSAACSCSMVQMRKMRPSYAQILEIVDVQGASLEKAAEEIGISANNAGVRLHRARRALRDTLADHCGTLTAAECRDCHCVYAGCCET